MEIVADFACETGECPAWHPLEKALYWADIPNGKMFRFDPATGVSELVFQEGQLGGLVVQEDGSILQFMQEGRVQSWKAGKVKMLCDGIEAERGTRFNDATADLTGRVLAGTMPSPSGKARLYRFDLDGRYELLLDDVGQSNGIAFTADGRTVFHTDTKRKQITRYAYRDGHLADGQVAITIVEENAVPDGLTIDSAGSLWSAQWGGSCVANYTEEGDLLAKIELPTPEVSSVAFGGEGYRDLFITTAGGNEREKYGPAAGAVFRMPAAVPGRSPWPSRILI